MSPAPLACNRLPLPFISTPRNTAAKYIFVPGISTRGADGAPDVIRGEETQVFGASEGGSEHFVTPGTHSKWITVEDGEITGFSSYMTGEVFALLKTHSILGKLMTGETSKSFRLRARRPRRPERPGGIPPQHFFNPHPGAFQRNADRPSQLLSLRPGDRHGNRPCHCEKSGGRTVSDIGNAQPLESIT